MISISNFALNLQSLFFLTVSIFGIGFLITFHEMGHFIFCKIFDIKTPSFSIGFGPKILEKKIGDTNFSLSAIPMGGYVEIAGAAETGQGEQQHAFSKDQDSFANKPYYQKMCVIFGGILFNLFFAFFAFSTVYYLGMPESSIAIIQHGKTVIESVTDNSPAQKYGLKPHDKIISINNQKIENNIIKLFSVISSLANQEAQFVIERNGQEETLNIVVGEQTQGSKKAGLLGAKFETENLKNLGLIKSILYGFKSTIFFIKQTLFSFLHLIYSKSTDGVSGPIGVVSQIFGAAKSGISQLLLILSMISIGLAVLNLIPIPILDGGQALIYTIEALFRRELPANLKYYIQLSCWVLFIALFLYVSYKDMLEIFKPYLSKFFGQ